MILKANRILCHFSHIQSQTLYCITNPNDGHKGGCVVCSRVVIVLTNLNEQN